MSIENLTVRICQNLPKDLTLFENQGCCQKIDANCKYNRTNLSSDIQICCKNTTTPRFIDEVSV